MKFSHVNPMSLLLVSSTLVSQALSLPRWSSHFSPRLAKRASRVAYAGVNIAGCDFGIDTNVSEILSAMDMK